LKPLKIGAQVQVTVRRVVVRLASSYPFQELFLAIYRRLQGMEPLRRRGGGASAPIIQRLFDRKGN
jgi:hypothetical protein